MTKARDLASSGVTLTSTTTTADAALARAGGTMTGNLAMGTNLVDGVDVSARDAVLTDTTTKATAALPKAGGAMTGAITTNSTFDGVDIATRDGILSSTTTTATAALNNANSALSREGGAMTGAITTNSTFDGVDVGARNSVLTSTTTTANAALPKAGGAMTGAITTNSTFDGRDVAADGVLATNALPKSGGAVTGNVTFGDNDKAIFGAGSDLSIYHNTAGFTGNIIESPVTNLYIRSNNLYFQKGDGTENNVIAISDGAVTLSYDNAPKLATTATGIDVTGLLKLSSIDPILRFNDTNGGTDTKNFEMRYVGTSSPDIDGLYFRTANDALNSYSNNMVILGSGNVGIGTSSPSAYGSGYTTVGVNGSTMSGVEGFVNGTLTSYMQTYATQTFVGTKTATPLVFVTNDTQRMRIDSSGNVGIDFTPKTMNANVTSSLNVGSGTVFQRTKDTYLASNLYYNASDVGKSISTGYGLAYYQDVTNGAHKWFTSSGSAGSADATHSFTTPLIINSSGHIGINCTPASATFLDVKGKMTLRRNVAVGHASAGNWTFNISHESSAVYGTLYLTSGVSTGEIDLMGSKFRFTKAGNLMVGTTSASAKITSRAIGGTAYSAVINASGSGMQITSEGASNSMTALTFRTNYGAVGSITCGSATAYNTSSDYRLKENVVYDWDATTRLKQLKPARFNWIADDTNTTIDGFLAHEAQTVVPESVTGIKDAMRDEEYEVTAAVEQVTDDDGNITTEGADAVMGTRSVPDIQGIDQSKLVPLLVKTILELEARITALEA